MNLLPDRPAVTPSYCCTWNVQNFGRPDAAAETDPNVFAGQDGAKKARAFLNEQNLFGPGGLCDQYACHRRGIPCHSLWLCGRHHCRRCRGDD